MRTVLNKIAVSIMLTGLCACAGNTGNVSTNASCEAAQFDARSSNHFLRARRIGSARRENRGGSCNDHA